MDMHKIISVIIVAAHIFMGVQAQAADETVPDNAQITFIEFGSVRCIPCKKMQPIMNAIEEKYAGRVKVIFHDVWTAEGEEYGRTYGIRLIPTQVFLDKDGNEVFRHEGFFPQEDIEQVLADHGVTE